MNQEIVERLVMDKALGELSPDATALLDNWLAREPQAKVDATKIEETLTLAKGVLKVQASHGRAKLLLRQGGAAAPPYQRPAWFPWAIGMAACFVVGIGVGTLPSREAAPMAVASHISENVNAEVAQDPRIWSTRRLLVPTPSAKPQGRRLVWKSPVTKPQWENPSSF